MSPFNSNEINILQQADWELDFYSRPIIESDGKKRWELLITNSKEVCEDKNFRLAKRCPAGEVNSIWLAEALKEALDEAQKQGWSPPAKIRCWRTSMKTMVSKAAAKVGLEVISSRRTYALQEWISQREREVYPQEEGYIAGPFPTSPSTQIISSAVPLPEAVRGDAWALATIPLGVLRDAKEWPMEFSGLLPVEAKDEDSTPILGLRIFSESRALALAGWLGGLEPVKLTIEGNQLLLEAGQEDRWLVTDLSKEQANEAKKSFSSAKVTAKGLQFISVQTSPEEEKFTGFWMCKDLN